MLAEPASETQLTKLVDYTRHGNFKIEVNGLQGCLGIVKATAGMTTEGLTESVSSLTGTPAMQQRLLQGTSVLRPGKYIAAAGLSPLNNQITAVRTSELPDNPTITWKALAEILPGRHLPTTVAERAAVQDHVWPGYPPLKPGWIRILIQPPIGPRQTYFFHTMTEEGTRNFSTARAEEPPCAWTQFQFRRRQQFICGVF